MSKAWLSTFVGAALLSSPQIGAALAADFGGTDTYLYSRQPLAQALVEIGGGIWSYSGSTYGAISAAGAANIPLTGGWNLAPELSVVSVFSSSVGTGVAGVVHAFYRDPQSHALGIYAGGVGNSAGAGSAFVVGLDGLLYMPRSTFYAQAGYFSGASVGQGGQIVGTVRYFPSDNTKLQGSLGYAASNAGISVFGVSATAEQRFDQSPFSAFLTGTYLASTTSAADQGSLMVGARMYFNNETLFQNDREGVTTNFVKLF